MIFRLEGRVVERSAGRVVLAAGGVGYGVRVLAADAAELTVGEPAALAVHEHVSARDGARELYGFLLERDRAFFELLLEVKGLGPAAALGLMAVPVEQLRAAILQRDVVTLLQIPGVGKKRAESVIFELEEKLRAQG